MSGPRITWADGAAPEVRRAAGKLFRRWARILPKWLARLTLDYRQEVEESAGTVLGVCLADHDHREATVYLTGAWLEEAAPRRQWVVVHEYCHVGHAPVDDWVEQMLEQWVPDPYRAQARKGYESVVEQVMSDAADAFLRVVDE